MKTRTFLFAFLLVALFASPLAAPRAEANVSVSISVFHDSLAPYGSWVSVGRYGTCWRPAHVRVGWQPYLDGEWIWTDAGWTWVSYDPWVSYPWHYGTWVYSAEYGWVWIPGTTWAPAWVTWYVSGDYCGWAPVPPSLYVGISGYAGPPVRAAASAYVFVPTAQLAGVDARTVRAPIAQNTALASRARPMTRFAATNGVLASGGPVLADVERARGRAVPRAAISQAKTEPVRVAAAPHGRTTVVAPARERARLVAPRPAPTPKSEPRRVERTTRQQPPQTLVKPRHEGPPPPAPHASAPPSPRERHGAEVPQHTGPPQHAGPPPQVRHAPPAAVQAERHAPPPQAPPPQAHGNPPPPQAHGNPPPKEHGKEKGD